MHDSVSGDRPAIAVSFMESRVVSGDDAAESDHDQDNSGAPGLATHQLTEPDQAHRARSVTLLVTVPSSRIGLRSFGERHGSDDAVLRPPCSDRRACGCGVQRRAGAAPHRNDRPGHHARLAALPRALLHLKLSRRDTRTGSRSCQTWISGDSVDAASDAAKSLLSGVSIRGIRVAGTARQTLEAAVSAEVVDDSHGRGVSRWRGPRSAVDRRSLS